jgi:serine phosphatase RsbU (regulator of sigma subunit)
LVLKTQRMTVAGVLEPAYDVGGDCFDYALNDTVLDMAIFDPMGHGIQAALIASLAVGSYRHDRRENQPLKRIHVNLESALAHQFQGSVFATGAPGANRPRHGRADLDERWASATHGVVEAHLPREKEFGVDRLVDLATQHASNQLEPEEIVRHLVRSVLDHQSDRLPDDATVVLFQWNGPLPAAPAHP